VFWCLNFVPNLSLLSCCYVLILTNYRQISCLVSISPQPTLCAVVWSFLKSLLNRIMDADVTNPRVAILDSLTHPLPSSRHAPRATPLPIEGLIFFSFTLLYLASVHVCIFCTRFYILIEYVSWPLYLYRVRLSKPKSLHLKPILSL
jgi:hypothetical protein